MATPSDNLFITGLPEGTDDESLKAIMGAYGSISSIKIMTPQPGRKCAALVRFSTVDEAKWLVENLNGNIPQGLAEAVEVKYANAGGAKGKDGGKDAGWGGKGDSWGGKGGGPYGGDKGGWGGGGGKGENPPSDNLFISGLPENYDEAQLSSVMGTYGTITSCKLMTPQPGRKCAGLVRFSSVEEAKWIVDNVNGNIPQGLTEAVEVKYANAPGAKGGGKDDGWGGKGGGKGGKGKCSIRTLTQGLTDAGALPGGPAVNDENTLFVAGLPYDTSDVDLYKMFSPFSCLKGVKAVQDRDTGMSKGIGFVHMMDQASAQMAISTLNGTMLPDGSWLTVKIKTDGPKGKGKDGEGGDGGKGKW